MRSEIEIRESVYQDIRITKLEKQVIDTKEFQRLRRVHQLPEVHYVYADATHNRFSQSLGTMRVATEIFNNIPEIQEKEKNKKSEVTEDRKYLRLAALLYDIHDPPFYHVFYEDLENEKVTNKALNKIKQERIQNICDNIKGPLSKEISYDELMKVLESDPNSERRYIRQIIDSEVGADRIEYLTRDSKFCGVHYGQVDPRIFTMYRLIDNELVLSREAISLVDDIFQALFSMRYNVYDHKIPRVVIRMIHETYKSYLETKKRGKEKLIKQLAEFDDCEFLDALMKFENDNKDRIPQYVTRIVTERDLLKVPYILEAPALKSVSLITNLVSMRQERASLENEIEERYKTKVLLDFVPLTPPKTVSLKVQINDDPVPISSSPLLSQWYGETGILGHGERALTQWKMLVYTEEENYKDVCDTAKELFEPFLLGEHKIPTNPLKTLEKYYGYVEKLAESRKAENYISKIISMRGAKKTTLSQLFELGFSASSKDLAEYTGRSPSAENMYLEELHRDGFVERERLGHAYKYKLPLLVAEALRKLRINNY